MTDVDEFDLVARAKAGESAALDALIRLHQGPARAFLAARLHDVSMADDLAQDAFVIACARLDSFDPSLPFYPWVHGIAHNVLRHHLRTRRAVPTDPHDLAALLDQTVHERADRLGDHDHLDLLRHCLEGLAGTTAETVRAHYFEARSLSDIAEVQGRSAKAVGVMLVRARKFLHDCLLARIQGHGEATA
ncbi:MAG: sigma-70 family RNA polymerase sigma factor [Planctomycetes bacterium]|nr:sigma-70 family RNA polymerase sigma factor [Planctomycetota bacterium]